MMRGEVLLLTSAFVLRYNTLLRLYALRPSTRSSSASRSTPSTPRRVRSCVRCNGRTRRQQRASLSPPSLALRARRDEATRCVKQRSTRRSRLVTSSATCSSAVSSGARPRLGIPTAGTTRRAAFPRRQRDRPGFGHLPAAQYIAHVALPCRWRRRHRARRRRPRGGAAARAGRRSVVSCCPRAARALVAASVALPTRGPRIRGPRRLRTSSRGNPRRRRHRPADEIARRIGATAAAEAALRLASISASTTPRWCAAAQAAAADADAERPAAELPPPPPPPATAPPLTTTAAWRAAAAARGEGGGDGGGDAGREAEALERSSSTSRRRRFRRCARSAKLRRRHATQLKGAGACEIDSGEELLMTELIVGGTFNNPTAQSARCAQPDRTAGREGQRLPPLPPEPAAARDAAGGRVRRRRRRAVTVRRRRDQVRRAVPNGMVAMVPCGARPRLSDLCDGRPLRGRRRVVRRLRELLDELKSAAKAIGNDELYAKFGDVRPGAARHHLRQLAVHRGC